MPKFVRQAKCVNGKRAMCVTKYETMCTNKEVTREMEEDYPRWVYKQSKFLKNATNSPSLYIYIYIYLYILLKIFSLCRCRVEMMKKCSNSTGETVNNFLFPRKKNKVCQKVPAMRCRIEKRKVCNGMTLSTCYLNISLI